MSGPAARRVNGPADRRVSEPLAHIVGDGPDAGVPMRLWELHGQTPVGTRHALPATSGAGWPDDLLAAVLSGGGLVPDGATRWRRDRTLADTAGPGMRMLVVGLNPSVYAADVGVGFGRPGNRFWPAALAAGLVTVDRDPRAALLDHGVGMTDLVKRATPRADELRRDEYVAGVERLDLLCGWLRPAVVCVVGLSGWRTAVDRRAVVGPQDRTLGGRPVFVMHNPSGLNAHVTVDDLADQLGAALSLAPSRRPPLA